MGVNAKLYTRMVPLRYRFDCGFLNAQRTEIEQTNILSRGFANANANAITMYKLQVSKNSHWKIRLPHIPRSVNGVEIIESKATELQRIESPSNHSPDEHNFSSLSLYHCTNWIKAMPIAIWHDIVVVSGYFDNFAVEICALENNLQLLDCIRAEKSTSGFGCVFNSNALRIYSIEERNIKND